MQAQKSADTLFQRARAYHEKGDRERAIVDLTRAYSRDPKLERAICEFSHQADLSLSGAGGDASILGNDTPSALRTLKAKRFLSDGHSTGGPQNQRAGQAALRYGPYARRDGRHSTDAPEAAR